MWFPILYTLLVLIPSGVFEVSADECGTNYVTSEGKYYVYNSNPLIWKEAMQFCQENYGGHLLWIKSNSTQELAVELIRNATTQHNLTWIGHVVPAHRKSGEKNVIHQGKFVNMYTLNNTKFQYTNWLRNINHSSTPDNYSCVAIDSRQHFYWTRELCQYSPGYVMYPSICQADVHTLTPSVIMVEEGENLTITCTAVGYPRATLNWQHNSSHLQADNVTNMRNDTKQNCTAVTTVLTVTGADPRNDGRYRCKISTTEKGIISRLPAYVFVGKSKSLDDKDSTWGAQPKNWEQTLWETGTLSPDVARAYYDLRNASNSSQFSLRVQVQLAQFASVRPITEDVSRAVTEHIALGNSSYDLTLPGAETEIRALLQVTDRLISTMDTNRSSNTSVNQVSSHDVVFGLERLLLKSAATLPRGGTFNATGPIAGVWMRGTTDPDYPGLVHIADGVEVELQPQQMSLKKSVKITSVITTFPNFLESVVPSGGANKSTVSPLVAVNLLVGGAKFSVPVVISFKTRKRKPSTTTHNIVYKCAFMTEVHRTDDKSLMSGSDWSTDGCQMTSWSDDNTTCSCNHTTNFAILMSITRIPLGEQHKMALSIVTYVGCGISMISLLITLTVFVAFRMFRSTRTLIHMNLCCTLLLLQISFLGGATVTHLTVACVAVTVVLHVAALAVFCWMFVEALHLYLKVVKVYGAENSPVLLYHIIGYVPPVVVATVTAGVGHRHYLAPDRENCWLPLKDGLFWAFIGPAILILMINLVVVILVLRIIVNSSKIDQQKTNADFVKSAARGLLVLMPITGLSWIVGLFAVNEQTIAFQYLFAVINSLQGFFVFLFHCILNKEVQAAFGRWKQNRAMSSFSSSRGGLHQAKTSRDVHPSSAWTRDDFNSRDDL